MSTSLSVTFPSIRSPPWPLIASSTNTCLPSPVNCSPSGPTRLLLSTLIRFKPHLDFFKSYYTDAHIQRLFTCGCSMRCGDEWRPWYNDAAKQANHRHRALLCTENSATSLFCQIKNYEKNEINIPGRFARRCGLVIYTLKCTFQNVLRYFPYRTFFLCVSLAKSTT